MWEFNNEGGSVSDGGWQAGTVGRARYHTRKGGLTISILASVRADGIGGGEVHVVVCCCCSELLLRVVVGAGGAGSLAARRSLVVEKTALSKTNSYQRRYKK